MGGVISLLFFFTAPYAHLIFTRLTVVNPLPKIARMMDTVFGTGDELIWGYTGHFIVSTIYGLGFGIFRVIVKPKNLKMDLFIGLLFGTIYTLIGPFFMMPFIMDTNPVLFSDMQFFLLELSIHQAFALPMALVFRLGVKNEN